MEYREKTYTIGNITLSGIRNRNERRVVKTLLILLAQEKISCTDNMIRDIYACALNYLPARYTQTGTIVLRDPVQDSAVEEAVKLAMNKILLNPNE